MKKILIGCGIVSLVLFLGLVALGVFGFVQAKRVFGNWENSRAQLETLETKHPYTPPADETFKEERLADYFEVRDALLAHAQANPTVSKLLNTPPGQAPNVGAVEMLGLVTGFVPDMLNKLTAELDQRQMSFSEFKDNSERIYATIRAGYENNDGGMKTIYESLDNAIAQFNLHLANNNQGTNQLNFNQATSDALSRHEIPEINYEMLNEYRLKLTEDPLMTFIELMAIQQIDMRQGSPAAVTGTLSLPSAEATDPVEAEATSAAAP